MTGPDIVCLGEPLIEFNQVRGESHYLRGFGGDTSNCAIAAARQGAGVGYVTAVGTDAFGEALISLWRDEGVDTSAVYRDAQAPTGVYFVSHTARGHQFSYYRSGSAASRLAPSRIDDAYIAGAKFLQVSGISQAISASACDAVYHAIDVARANGVHVAYDTNLRLNLWPLDRARAIIHDTVRRCEIVLPGLDDARTLTGYSEPDAIADFYLELDCAVVALTLGHKGTLVATRDERRHVAGFDVQAVDTTAAGDTFDGAFLARLSEGDDPFAAARFANAAAALSTLGYGAVAPMPAGSDVSKFLATQSGHV